MDKRGAHRSQCILSCIQMFIFNLGPGSQTDSPAKFSVWTMFIKVGLVGWLLFTLIYLSTFLWVCNIHSGGGGGDVTVDWRLLSGVVSSCNSKSWKTCKNVKQETLKGYFSLFSLLLYIRILQTLQLLAKKTTINNNNNNKKDLILHILNSSQTDIAVDTFWGWHIES